MTQTRICWTAEVGRLKRESRTSSQWAELGDSMRENYEVMSKAGNEVFGHGSHWIEERMVAAQAMPAVALAQAPPPPLERVALTPM